MNALRTRPCRSASGLLILGLLAGCIDYEVCTTHYLSGQPWSVRYLKQEHPHRPWVAWYKNQRAALETYYHLGQRTGTWKTFDKAGKALFERSYTNDEPSGEWHRYYHDGSPYETGRFERGRRVGVWKRFLPGGVLIEEASYYDGLYQGERRLFDADGKLLRKENYLAGELQSG